MNFDISRKFGFRLSPTVRCNCDVGIITGVAGFKVSFFLSRSEPPIPMVLLPAPAAPKGLSELFVVVIAGLGLFLRLLAFFCLSSRKTLSS